MMSHAISDTLDSLWNRLAARTAIGEPGGGVTYAELLAASHDISRLLAKQLRQPGQRVALLLPNSSAFVAAFFGAARLGAVVAPLATQYRAQELAFYLDDIRADVDRVSRKLGRRLTFLVGKPGLDGHSNGAEQIAVRARDAGMQVVYEGIRLTPEEIVEAARKQKAHVVGLSVLSGSHLPLVEDVVGRMKKAGLDVPVIVGGIIPPEDAAELEKAGVAAVYTPKDFELNRIMSDVVRIVERAKGASNV